MGYEINDTVTLKPGDYPGLEVTARLAATFREYEELKKMAGLDADDAGALDDGLHAFADRFLVGWNVETHGEPLEPTADNFDRIPPMMKAAVFGAWMETMRAPAGPLDNASSTPSDFQEQSIDEPDAPPDTPES